MGKDQNRELKMSFEPKTIEHLGLKMYSHIPPALAELIANSYDACATTVHIELYDGQEKKIVVRDSGIGMTFDEVNNFFLRIGRNRREEKQDSGCGRVATGKKGLGKLALFGIGKTITIRTIKDGTLVEFTLDWDAIMEGQKGDYKPIFLEKETDESSGTTFILTKLKRSSNFPPDAYSASISKLFNFKDEDFKVYMSLNGGEPNLIDNKLKYRNIEEEFKWIFPDESDKISHEYVNKKLVKGKVITTEKPLKPDLRGITLFANGRMVNASEFFGVSESSHFFSYTTGWLDVDFVDEIDEDLISTDRQSLNWDSDITIGLSEYLKSILRYVERDWRQKRKKKRQDKVEERTKIDISNWLTKVPVAIKEKLETLISKVDESELSTADQTLTIESLHSLVPEYPLLHWRHLHADVQSAARFDYERRDYYRAFIEAVKRYINDVRKISESKNSSDSGMMGGVFGLDKVLEVAKRYNKPDGTKFHSDTYKCIEDGQKYLSMGIVAGARNPISHEEIADLRESNLFSEKDCLDMLSLLSHLFNRLDNVTVNEDKK